MIVLDNDIVGLEEEEKYALKIAIHRQLEFVKTLKKDTEVEQEVFNKAITTYEKILRGLK